MMSAIIKKIKPKVMNKFIVKKDEVFTIRVLVYNQNVWGSDTIVSALQEKNSISKRYWIERIDVVQYARAVLDNVIEHSYDVLIMSYDVDRFCLKDIVKKIKEVDAKIKILILSNAHVEEIEKLIDEGLVDGSVLVPLQSSKLWKEVDSLMDE